MSRERSRASGVLLAASLVLLACKSNSAGTDKADGADAAVMSDAVESVESPPPSQELGHCTRGQAGTCRSGSECVQGCLNRLPTPGGVCSVSGRESCGCGVIPSPCTTPGLVCLTCCDSAGLCVTPAEKAIVCAGPDSARFDCSN
jgi:hypothetical protein